MKVTPNATPEKAGIATAAQAAHAAQAAQGGAGNSDDSCGSDIAARGPARNWAARNWAARNWAALVTAVQFMTRVPLSSKAPTSDSLRRAPLFFPLVGLGIGCFTAGAMVLAILVWPVWIAVILAIAAELRLTGALHEDGLADFCDGFGGGWDQEQVLRILKDSRIGTYGTLGLGLGVGLRIACLVGIVGQYGSEGWLYGAVALVASAAVGRWMIVLSMTMIPPLTNRESLSRDVGSQMTWRCFVLSGLGAFPAVALFAYLMPFATLLACGLTTLGLWMLGSLIRRKLGGMTGDCLGCIGYVSQVLWLLSAAARVA